MTCGFANVCEATLCGDLKEDTTQKKDGQSNGLTTETETHNLACQPQVFSTSLLVLWAADADAEQLQFHIQVVESDNRIRNSGVMPSNIFVA